MTDHSLTFNAGLVAGVQQLGRSNSYKLTLSLAAMVVLLPLVIYSSWLQRDAMPGPDLLGATVLITLANAIAATSIAALLTSAARAPRAKPGATGSAES
jgi:hypothetical protein